LGNARKDGKRGPFVIAVPTEHFRVLWETAGETEPTESMVSTVSDEASFEDRLLAERVDEALVKDYVGCSRRYQLVRSAIVVAARTDDPVLIMGETGTGKEIVARAIHKRSQRAGGPFIAVNCAAIPETLFESELFGHEKGAFTGASQARLGYWRAAADGILFLDEIGDLCREGQAKVLRVLQEGKIQPVGMEQEVKVNVRVLAATHRDLFAMVQEGRFRQDLLYRLLQWRIETPPLTDSPEDLELIAQSVWQSVSGGRGARLGDEVIRQLQSCPWPGNVRELTAVLRQAHSVVGDGRVTRRLIESVVERFPSDDVSPGGDLADGGPRFHARCLRQLCHLADALRACQVVCRPLDQSVACAADVLRTMRGELERQLPVLDRLTAKPALLWKESLFDMVDVVRNGIERVARATSQGDGDCQREWRQGLAPTLREAICRTVRETRALAGGEAD
jgi:transcriptional regulator with GAF, ATPase, and Fis domain